MPQFSIDTLRLWSQILLWVSVVLPVIAAFAAGARYYIERHEKSLSAEATASAIRQAREEAATARSEVSEAREAQARAELTLRESLSNLEGSAAEKERLDAALAALKRTPPKLNAHLAVSDRTGEVMVVIDAENLVPFKARWSLVTERDRIVAGIMLEDQEIHPAEGKRRFTAEAEINAEQVVNEFVELRFRYVSVFAPELGNPKELAGAITSRYRYRNGGVYAWDSRE